ncbi:MAG: heme NO-binding domain-containing protein [Pseudomonadota bacterium]
MHGLINKGLQGFLTDAYGEGVWYRIANAARLRDGGFEAFLTYHPRLTRRVLAVAESFLGKPQDVLLEDLGSYLVASPKLEAFRRLLRFGGEDFSDFIQSLDELPERARLAVPDLVLPTINIREPKPNEFELICQSNFSGFCTILAGMLRAMADDYGTLSLIEWENRDDGSEVVFVRLLDGTYFEGREFDLAAGTAG